MVADTIACVFCTVLHRIVLSLPQIDTNDCVCPLLHSLLQLQERLDAAAYAAMVADVTPDEAAAAAAREDPFLPTTKLQLSFGLHVIVTMGTFFAVGWYGGRLLLHSNTWVSS